jgi:hypothetical protein
VDRYSTLSESISRDSKVSPEKLSTTMGGSVSLKDKKSPLGMKRIVSLPEMQLPSPHQEILTEISYSQVGPNTYNTKSDSFSSNQTNSLSICSEGNFYPDDVTERIGYIHSEVNYGGKEAKESIV